MTKVKLRILTILICCAVTFALWKACDEKTSESVAASEVIPQEPDYADASQWYSTEREGEADIFYVISTETGDYATKDGMTSHYVDTYADSLRMPMMSEMEGGDYIPAGNISLIGCGMRTNDEGIRQMMEADAFGHDTVVVVRDHKLWQMQMHLDTHFNIIDSDLCTMVRSRLEAKPGEPEYGTCDIWARKPGTLQYSLWHRDVPFVEYILSRGFQIIPIDFDDEMHYANNFLTIAPRHIMAVGGQSEELQQRFHDAGVTVEWIPLESLIDGYGAAHCMTQVLQRETYIPTPTDINAARLSVPADGKAYCIDGNPATVNTRGIVIEDGKKIVSAGSRNLR